MRTFIYLLLSMFFLASLGANEKSMDIWRQIDDLQKQRPVLVKTISYCKSELPEIKNALKDTKKYRKEMDRVIDKNLVNAVVSGGISVGFEVLGGFSGGKAVELGAWIVGKGIGVAMEKSGTFGGVSHYNQKIASISDSYKKLNPELDKLKRVSQLSDQAIKSYYSKYGKYSETFEIGDVGVFTSKMRLIVEQADVATVALEELHLRLFRTLEEAEKDLKRLDKQIERLSRELKELNDEDKNKNEKEEPKKIDLSEDEKKITHLPKVKGPTIEVPGVPKACYKSYISQEEHNNIKATLNSIRNNFKTQNEIVGKLSERMVSEQDAYLQSILEKRARISSNYKLKHYKYNLDGDAHERVKQGIYPTGVPFNVFIQDTVAFNNMLRAQRTRYNNSLRELTESMLSGLPTPNAKDLAEAYENRWALEKRYIKVDSECYGSYRDVEPLPDSKGRHSSALMDLKSLKVDYLQELARSEKFMKEYPIEQSKRMSILRSYFAQRRSEMQEEITRYEASVSKQESYRKNIITKITELHGLYNSGLFTRADGNSGYQLVLQTQMKKSVCNTIEALRSEISSGAIASVISLEKSLKSLFSRERLYGVHPFPHNAYVEYGADIKALQEKRDKAKVRYSNARQQYIEMGSNAQDVEQAVLDSRFYQLGLFYSNTVFKTISDKLMQESKQLKNIMKNFRVEVTSAGKSSKITEERLEHLEGFHKNVAKRFKENFACLPLNHQIIEGMVEEIDTLKSMINKLKSKSKYMDAKGLIAEAEKLLENLKSFSIDIEHPNAFLKDYQALKDEYTRLDELTNKTYVNSLFRSDIQTLNQILLDIEPYFYALDEHKKLLESDSQSEIVEALYTQFAQEYSGKNLGSLMSLIADDWSSESDGTTLMDLEDTLHNSFSVFDEINCDISSLNIENVSSKRYRVNYVITIEGYIYDSDIRHEEKSSVYEEVSVKGGKAKISKTYNGRFWPTR